MSKGLKQMVEDAMSSIEQQATPEVEPVDMSGDALHVLATKIREWSGWPDATLTRGAPKGSPYASCSSDTHAFHFDPDLLVLNPHRVLYTMTPFRMRQEAVLTGALLHEAGHARHSRWIPPVAEQMKGKRLLHKDGTPPTKQTVAVARMMEESRIEGLMARDEKQVGAATLGWTMRAMAAHIAPGTVLSADPNQQIMDLLYSWALRAGRQYALDGRLSNYRLRGWVQDFTTLLTRSIEEHLAARVEAGALDCEPLNHARKIVNTLIAMTTCDDDTGPDMIDMARLVLGWLFPETPGETGDDQPMPGGCSVEAGPSDEEPEESEPEQGESEQGESEPEQGEQEDGEGQDGEGQDEADSDGNEDQDSDGDSPDSGDDSESDASPSSGDGQAESPEQSKLQDALDKIEAQAKVQTEEQASDDAEDAAEQAVTMGTTGGKGEREDSTAGMGGYRLPVAEERAGQRRAGQFLRTMIDATESSSVTLTDAPSSKVDGRALAAWKAGGERTAPRFFSRTRREVKPAPPVEIAILVDVSYSMSPLQKPSALLSWELSSAALDLRNFAGRGQQVRSCLIHWGDDAKVIQHVGETIPGIKVHSCNDGTSAMADALDLVEAEMPGFFDVKAEPTNRLLVQFTDWELFGTPTVIPKISAALESGVNMLSVVPATYRVKRAGGRTFGGGSDLPDILARCPVQRGKASLLKYNPAQPDQVWTQAAEMLS